MAASLTPFLLFPLYLYPYPASRWNPLFEMATKHPNVNFQIVVNPNSGPGADNCPDSDHAAMMRKINAEFDNIYTLGYVHTADSWDCGDSGTDICVTSMDIEELKGEVDKYSNWGTDRCPEQGAAGVDGIFFDESPYLSNQTQVDYMREASTHARTVMRPGHNAVYFNAGTKVEDPAYWAMADYICALEGSLTEAMNPTWENAPSYTAPQLLDHRTSTEGVSYADQTSVILYNYNDRPNLEADMRMILGKQVASLSVSEFDGATAYKEFSARWEEFVGLFDDIVNGD